MKSVRFRDTTGIIRKGVWKDGAVRYYGTEFEVQEVEILPPVEPGKIVVIGRNHVSALDEQGIDPPKRPRIFIAPPSSAVGHDHEIPLPADKESVHFGAELGVVIGRQCTNLDRSMADDVIAGYTCVNDLSNNDDIDIDPGKARVKGFDRSKPIGPVVVDHKTVPQDAEISLRLNGTTKQRATIDGYHYSVGEVIEEVTSYITLDSGDVITMGSPAGISHVEEGETMEVEIEGIGVLRTEIAETE